MILSTPDSSAIVADSQHRTPEVIAVPVAAGPPPPAKGVQPPPRWQCNHCSKCLAAYIEPAPHGGVCPHCPAEVVTGRLPTSQGHSPPQRDEHPGRSVIRICHSALPMGAKAHIQHTHVQPIGEGDPGYTGYNQHSMLIRAALSTWRPDMQDKPRQPTPIRAPRQRRDSSRDRDSNRSSVRGAPDTDDVPSSDTSSRRRGSASPRDRLIGSNSQRSTTNQRGCPNPKEGQKKRRNHMAHQYQPCQVRVETCYSLITETYQPFRQTASQ